MSFGEILTKRLFGLAVLIALTLCVAGESVAQSEQSEDDTARVVYSTVLKDGSILIGTILRDTPDTVVVEMTSGMVMSIPRTQIKRMERLSGKVVQGEYLRRDPNDTRMIFAPTARPLRSGQGYFAVYEVFFPYLSVGILDVLSVGAGMSLFPGASTQLFYIVPKISIPLAGRDVAVAAGALYTNLFSSDREGSGILYGLGTVGSDRAAATIGLGYGFRGGDIADDPILMLGGEIQVSNGAKFLTENWFPLDSDINYYSFGVRFFGDHLAGDFGFIYPVDNKNKRSRGFPMIPWIGFSYNFGGK